MYLCSGILLWWLVPGPLSQYSILQPLQFICRSSSRRSYLPVRDPEMSCWDLTTWQVTRVITPSNALWRYAQIRFSLDWFRIRFTCSDIILTRSHGLSWHAQSTHIHVTSIMFLLDGIMFWVQSVIRNVECNLLVQKHWNNGRWGHLCHHANGTKIWTSAVKLMTLEKYGKREKKNMHIQSMGLTINSLRPSDAYIRQ